MSIKDKSDKSISESNSGVVDKSAARRRFIKGAISTTPVILSLANRPAWGVNCTLSGMLSATHASHHDQNAPCETTGLGCTPGFWKSNPSAWKVFGGAYSPGNVLSCPAVSDYYNHHSNSSSSYYDKQTKCYLLDLGGGIKVSVKDGAQDWDNTGTKFSDFFGSGYYSETCMQMLQLYEGSLEFHAIAAVLNALAFPADYGYSASYIVDVYRQIVDEGDGAKISALHDTLDYLNNRGCPINAHGTYTTN